MDFADGLDFGLPSRYPAHLEHPVICWSDDEEDLQLASLSWFIDWSKTNRYLMADSCFARPIKHEELWSAMKDRIHDWAWLQKGGLALNEIQSILLERHHVRLKETK